MHLFNPRAAGRTHQDATTAALMRQLVEYFEKRGAQSLRDDYHQKRWYDGFLSFVREHRLFATLLTPAGRGAADARWDTWRISELAEILGFYGLEYWYTWQVSVLGLGPLWMSHNEPLKLRTSKLLQAGGIFAFGLSEKAHGADIYSTDMLLTPQADGSFTARGSKYYIGNGNKAALVSTFGKRTDNGEYVFFAVESTHAQYECVKNIVISQSYVSEFALHDYPVQPHDIIATGPQAWDAALNTVNIGKYNLGWASIGICTHALYEAVPHAANRQLYNMRVTDFPHVKRLLTDATTRLLAMRAFAFRAADYMRSASATDRRYLLFNPMVKMKVTTQGEQVINLIWDVIAARGFEKDMYFQEATSAIRALPKLEGTVHVNLALLIKFMPNYFFNPGTYAPVPQRHDATDDTFLFDQGTTKGLGKIQFHDFNEAYKLFDLPNVHIFRQQISAFQTLLMQATPSDEQRKDTDFLLGFGEIFALVVYGQLVLEYAHLNQTEPDMVAQIFDFMVRDAANLALELYNKAGCTAEQAALCLPMLQRPEADAARAERIWSKHVLPLKDAYQMNP